jgi:hypothetical protein
MDFMPTGTPNNPAAGCVHMVLIGLVMWALIFVAIYGAFGTQPF